MVRAGAQRALQLGSRAGGGGAVGGGGRVGTRAESDRLARGGRSVFRDCDSRSAAACGRYLPIIGVESDRVGDLVACAALARGVHCAIDGIGVDLSDFDGRVCELFRRHERVARRAAGMDLAGARRTVFLHFVSRRFPGTFVADFQLDLCAGDFLRRVGGVGGCRGCQLGARHDHCRVYVSRRGDGRQTNRLGHAVSRIGWRRAGGMRAAGHATLAVGVHIPRDTAGVAHRCVGIAVVCHRRALLAPDVAS